MELCKNGSRIFLPDVGPEVFINIVDAYKHVGTQCSVSPSICHEITNRVAIMNSESRALRKILRKTALPLNRKINAMQGYIFSKGLFQAGTWPALPPVQYKRIHSCILKLYRDVTRQYWSNTFDVSSMFSDSDIIYEYGFMCPMTMLRYFRMSLFSRIVTKEPPHLLALIDKLAPFPNTWASSLICDLKWLNAGSFWGDVPLSTFAALHDAIAADPRRFAHRVKVYCREPFANLASEVPNVPSLQHLGNGISCQSCPMIFGTLQQLSLHMFKAHKVRNPFRCYVSLMHCTVCLKEFHTRERSLNHVRYRSAACRSNLLLRGPSLTESEASALDEAEKSLNRASAHAGKRRHHVGTPAIQLQGPLLPIVLSAGVDGSHHPLGPGHSYLPS